MILSDLSIKRPVLTIVLSIVIVLFGVVGYMTLGVREYPSVDPPVINVTTTYSGANAEIIESQITEPLEEAINSVAGIESISSISSDGRSSITIEFEVGLDLDNAANDVRDKVSQAIRSLPPDTDPPVVFKADADAQFIFAVTLQSEKRDLLSLTEIGNNQFRERLQTVPGVSTVRIMGERRYAIRIIIDPLKLEAYQLTPLDIRNALSQQNVELPAGRIEGSMTELSVRALGRLNTPEEFNKLIVAKRGDVLVRLEDIGYARYGAANERTVMFGNALVPMVGVAIQPQPGANFIDIVDEAKSRIEQIKKEIPPDIVVNVAMDTTLSIRKAIEEVKETLLIAFVLVLSVIFFFLRSFRITLIPIIAIPISLIGTFAILYLAGYSINILTLLGLVLATGLVVDDSIVVIENIYSKVEQGLNPVQASFKGAREVFFAVVATSISLICVFFPIFFLGGLTGRLFREFAMVVSGAILISTFVSLSLTPMMGSRMLKNKEEYGPVLMAFKNIVDSLRNGYEKSLRAFMKVRWLAIPLVILISGLILLFGSGLQSELAPMEDKSRLRINSTAPEGTSYEAMENYSRQIMQLVDTISEKAFLMGNISPTFGSASGSNTANIRMTLTEPRYRKRSQMEVAQDLSRQIRKYSFAQTIVTQEPTIVASRRGIGGLPVQIVLQAPNLEKLRSALPVFMARAEADPTFDIVTVDLKFNKPEYNIEINRAKALDMGVSVSDIAQTLQTYLSDQRIGYFIKDGKQYYVIANAESKSRNEPLDLERIAARNNKGEMVPLSNLISLELTSRPPQLLRYNRYVSATVSASTVPGKTIGDGVVAMQKIAKEVLDESFTTSLTGSSSDFAKSSGNVKTIFIFALILVFLVLAAQFESFRDPLTIMITVPLALAGAVMSLYFFGHTLNIFSQIGIVVLIGIVTKNGILIVEFANQKREKGGLNILDAATEAAIQRFRPIVMTSLATMLGALPIALAIGEASTSRIPMGITIIGGLMFSLILTLYIIPALYTYITSKSPRVYVEEEID